MNDCQTISGEAINEYDGLFMDSHRFKNSLFWQKAVSVYTFKYLFCCVDKTSIKNDFKI